MDGCEDWESRTNNKLTTSQNMTNSMLFQERANKLRNKSWLFLLNVCGSPKRHHSISQNMNHHNFLLHRHLWESMGSIFQIFIRFWQPHSFFFFLLSKDFLSGLACDSFFFQTELRQVDNFSNSGKHFLEKLWIMNECLAMWSVYQGDKETLEEILNIYPAVTSTSNDRQIILESWVPRDPRPGMSVYSPASLPVVPS